MKIVGTKIQAAYLGGFFITNFIMNKLEYLLKLKSDPKQIYYTWKTLGGMTVNNSTKMYVKDNLFMVTEEGPMKGAFVLDRKSVV